jgi:ABC-type multidrug transport system permease subunit
MTISPEKQKQLEETAVMIGQILGKLIGGIVANAIIAGIIYAILALMIGLSVTYLQVFGAILLLDFIKAFIKK